MKEQTLLKANELIEKYKDTAVLYDNAVEKALMLKEQMVDLELNRIELKEKMNNIREEESLFIDGLKKNNPDDFIELTQNIQEMIINTHK